MALIDKTKRMIPMYVDESIYREIKVYAAETDQTMYEVLKPLSEEFAQSCIKLVTEIKEMKRQAELQRIKHDEEAKLVADNPIKVEGCEVDPIGNIIVEEPIAS